MNGPCMFRRMARDASRRRPMAWPSHAPTIIAAPAAQKGGGAALQDVPLPAAQQDGEESDSELADEDLEFVAQHGQHLGFLKNLDTRALDK